jgi:hypothetical protein
MNSVGMKRGRGLCQLILPSMSSSGDGLRTCRGGGSALPFTGTQMYPMASRSAFQSLHSAKLRRMNGRQVPGVPILLDSPTVPHCCRNNAPAEGNLSH